MIAWCEFFGCSQRATVELHFVVDGARHAYCPLHSEAILANPAFSIPVEACDD